MGCSVWRSARRRCAARYRCGWPRLRAAPAGNAFGLQVVLREPLPLARGPLGFRLALSEAAEGRCTRFAAGLALALQRGWLQPDGPWHRHLREHALLLAPPNDSAESRCCSSSRGCSSSLTPASLCACCPSAIGDRVASICARRSTPTPIWPAMEARPRRWRMARFRCAQEITIAGDGGARAAPCAERRAGLSCAHAALGPLCHPRAVRASRGRPRPLRASTTPAISVAKKAAPPVAIASRCGSALEMFRAPPGGHRREPRPSASLSYTPRRRRQRSHPRRPDGV